MMLKLISESLMRIRIFSFKESPTNYLFIIKEKIVTLQWRVLADIT